MAGLDLPYGTGYMLAGPLLTLGPPSLPLFFLGGGYGWCGLQSSTLVLPSGGGSKQKYGEPQAHAPPLGPSITHSSKSSVAGVQAGTLGAVFTALVCVSSPLAPLQPLLGVRVPPPE